MKQGLREATAEERKAGFQNNETLGKKWDGHSTQQDPLHNNLVFCELAIGDGEADAVEDEYQLI